MKANHTPTRNWIWAFIVYMLILLTIFILAYLKLIPVKLASIPMYDTAGHFILLGIASYLSHRALNRKMISLGVLRLPLGPVLISFFILIEESIQAFSPYRTASWSDTFSNLSGILLFYLFDAIWVWYNRKKRSGFA